jgi:eukaryotic-like serine/threonine-protein kinase
MKDTQPVRVRFGVFELDLKSGELRNGDHTSVLQEQPLQVLRMLIEREGELVTRDEIKKKLWPNDTIVEFDHSINTAIKNLRRVLGDSADEPKYIETVARRGYRLMVPVERVGTDDSSSPIPTLSSEAGEKGGGPQFPWSSNRRYSPAGQSHTIACWASSVGAAWAWSIALKTSSWAVGWH